MASKKKNNSKNAKEPQDASSTIAKSNDGTIQITFTISYKLIDKNRHEVAQELGKDIEVPGFRKGNAPVDKVIQHIPQNSLLEKTLGKILPDLFSRAIKEYKINPAVYPKFEIISAEDDKDWQVRSTTCELPEVDLSGYKQKILGEIKAKNIWTPDKGIKDDKKQEPELTQAQKEQEVIKAISNIINIKIPNVLIADEVNSRLSQLLERLEKLGLNLESYLASIGKTAESLREEYEKQAEESLKLDLTLIKIADEQNIKIKKEEIDTAISSSSGDQKLHDQLNTPQQRKIIENILKRRKALDSLTAMVG